MPSLLDDPWFTKKLDKVIARYRHLWTEDQVRAFREAAAWKLATDAQASKLLERERAMDTGESGTRLKEGNATERKRTAR